ncbi:hypothetical protein [Hydrocarboniphaga sp.]|uniref:hypothetical protein n=1 Tax=Hydrocarboniphaga sp. TaxID=2033016 RepID=UPI003D0A44DD
MHKIGILGSRHKNMRMRASEIHDSGGVDDKADVQPYRVIYPINTLLNVSEHWLDTLPESVTWLGTVNNLTR